MFYPVHKKSIWAVFVDWAVFLECGPLARLC